MRLYTNSLLNVCPWVILVALLILVAIVDWKKVWHSVLQVMLAVVVVIGGIGYFVFSRLAGWLPRWFPGQGTLSSLSVVLGLAALVALVVVVDWKQLWRKRKWQLIVGIELALLLLVYALGLYALVPGASAVETRVQDWIHLRPLTLEVMSARTAEQVPLLSFFSAQPKGELLAVTVKVTNSSKEPRYLWGNFELYDVQGRHFDMHPTSLLGTVDFFNPGLSSTATVVFDVPSVHGLWWLTVYPNPLNRLDGVSVPFLVP